MKPIDDPRVKCDHCDDWIGVYEPMVVMVDGEPHEASLAPQPWHRAEQVQRYHGACYLQRVRAEAA